jgi:hypothetical protein
MGLRIRAAGGFPKLDFNLSRSGGMKAGRREAGAK